MDEKKRLAVITSHPIQYNAPLFSHLARRQIIDVKVFYTWGESAMEKKFDPGFGKVIDWDIPLLHGYEFQFLKNIAKKPGSDHFNGIINPDIIQQVNTWKPDAVLVFGWSFRSHLKVMRHYKGKLPVLFRGDSTLLDDRRFSLKKILRHIGLKWVYRYIDYALYVGKNNRLYYKEAGVPENRLIFTPHAVDLDFFYDPDGAYQKAADEMKASLGIPTDELLFLFAGKLQYQKDPVLLAKAFSRLQVKNIHLLFVGNGDLEAKLKELCAPFRNIHFVDFQNQSRMPVVYRLGDIYVLSSRSETWGLAVNEAMACGKPVLISDQCGCADDLVHSGLNGYIFKSGDAGDLLDKLTETVAYRDKLPLMGKRSYELIQEWSYGKVCQTIETLLSDLNKK